MCAVEGNVMLLYGFVGGLHSPGFEGSENLNCQALMNADGLYLVSYYALMLNLKLCCCDYYHRKPTYALVSLVFLQYFTISFTIILPAHTIWWWCWMSCVCVCRKSLCVRCRAVAFWWFCLRFGSRSFTTRCWKETCWKRRDTGARLRSSLYLSSPCSPVILCVRLSIVCRNTCIKHILLSSWRFINLGDIFQKQKSLSFWKCSKVILGNKCTKQLF